MGKNEFITIEDLYREHCKDVNIKFSKNNFMKFLKFLEIDIPDWVESNLRYFNENE